MKYKRHKKIKQYKRVKLHEYAVLFNNSEQLIEFVCHTKSDNVASSSLYTQNGYYLLLLTSTTCQNKTKHICFKDKLHIDNIKLTFRLICKYDALHKMQKAFIKT